MIMVAVVAVIVLAGAGGASAYVYLHAKPVGHPPVLVVKLDDNVTVNYVGIFGSGPIIG